ncbi:MAG: response regulator [Pseudomonadota bacterium]
MSRKVLLIEDDKALRQSLAQALELEDIAVTQAASYIEAKTHISRDFPGVILTDLRMPGKDGFDVLEYARTCDAELPVILLTGEGDVPSAVRAMAAGAYDFLEKPCAPENVLSVLARAIEHRMAVLKGRQAESQLRRSDAAATNFPGSSDLVEALREQLRRAAGLPIHLHLHGPAGAGKRLAAHTIHALAGHAVSDEPATFHALSLQNAPMDALARLDMPEGALTLSVKHLDAATPGHQQDLLHLIEGRSDLRVISSSVAKLNDLRAKGLMEDLYFALNIMEIEVPGLEQRKMDLPAVFEALVRQSVRTLDLDMPEIPENVYAEVLTHDWPDNLPELRNFALSFTLGLQDKRDSTADLGLAEQMDAFEKMVLSKSLRRAGGKAAVTADALGLPRKTLYDKLTKHGLRPKDFQSTEG